MCSCCSSHVDWLPCSHSRVPVGKVSGHIGVGKFSRARMICVLPRLYIGCVKDTTDSQCLHEHGITHVLTVDSEPPKDLDQFHTKFVRLLDDSCADILSHLPECLIFVKEALGGSESSVLVHCHAGVSRSAAVITAFLMSTENLTFEDAYGRLQTIKTDVKINEEFTNQLALFEAMGYHVDMTSSIYKQYRLQNVTKRYPELQKLPQDVFASDPNLMGQTAEVLYRCRKCRRSLFRADSILNHILGNGPSAFAHKKVNLSTHASLYAQCTSYFVEPVQWMKEALLGVMDGQLLCPKCGSKLGCFNWYGEQCSCGRWVTPAFQVHKNRVDEVKTVTIRTTKT
uniref:Dual specificity protein phosphatase 12 n=2 Tax=Leptobrachium leishanense TaxID=445787 RepID=A0A8C5QRX1_9ANUR